MVNTAVRKIIKINEEKCDGCGLCVPACAEGALQIVNGKAKLIKESYCDGLGACLGECPQGAISIEEKEVEQFDEEAAIKHQADEVDTEGSLPCGCPSTMVTQFKRQSVSVNTKNVAIRMRSMLTHWPVQLTLVPPSAGFLQGSDLVLSADCVPFAYADFHSDFLNNHVLLIACPKLDDFQSHQKKLNDILKHSDIKSLTVIHMEVPCCTGLLHMAKQAIAVNGNNIKLRTVVIGVKGEKKSISSF